MRVVMHNFKIYLGVELALLILILIVMVLSTQGSFLRGAAVGLALQAMFTAVLDLIATRRGDAYLSDPRPADAGRPPVGIKQSGKTTFASELVAVAALRPLPEGTVGLSTLGPVFMGGPCTPIPWSGG